MAEAIQMGVSGVARDGSALNLGVSAVAREVTEGFLGVGGVARQFFGGKKPLNECSWELINEVSGSGLAPEWWSVGDTKDIVVGSETLTIAIAGFNHDDKTDGSGKAGVTFCIKKASATTRRMHSTEKYTGSYPNTEMHKWLINTLLPSLPSDLQAVIKPVNKKTSAGNNSATINTNSMKLFLFSEVEVTGSVTLSFAGEGTQYSYFTTEEGRKLNHPNDVVILVGWWLRSPRNYASSRQYHCYSLNTGTISSAFHTKAFYVRFGFCV